MKPLRAQRQQAFTLIEILLVIGLFALVAGLAISNFDGILEATAEDPIQLVIENTIQEARLLAMTHKAPMYLHFQADSKTLSIHNEQEETLFQSSRIFDPDSNDELAFFALKPALFDEKGSPKQASLDPLPNLPFAANGISPHFALQLSDRAELQWFDPLSGLPLRSDEN